MMCMMQYHIKFSTTGTICFVKGVRYEPNCWRRGEVVVKLVLCAIVVHDNY